MSRTKKTRTKSKAKRKTTKIAKQPAKRPQVLEGKPDQKLVQKFAEFVRSTIETKELEARLAIGRRFLKDFFDDDIELAESTSPHKKASWVMLKGKCGTKELPWSLKQLREAGQLAIQERKQLEAGRAAEYQQLSLSHRRKLKSVKDPKAVEQLARQAIEEGLTAQDLDRRRRSHQGKPPVTRTMRKTGHDFALTVLPRDVQTFRMLDDQWVQVVIRLPINDADVRKLINRSLDE